MEDSAEGHRFRRLSRSERPQERMERFGASALSDTELLAVLIRQGTVGQGVMEVAEQLLREGQSLAGLVRWELADFRRVPGIGPVKAIQLKAVVELARRAILQEDRAEPPVLDAPDKIYAFLRAEVAGLEVENFWVLVLNRKNRLIRALPITRGIADASLVHPREVFREVIREGGSAAVVAHNHPSGDPAPSAADVRVTRQLREAAGLLEIALLDHVILGEVLTDPRGVGFYSFSEAGVL